MTTLRIPDNALIVDHTGDGWDEFVKWLDGTYAILRYAWVDEGDAYQIAALDSTIAHTFGINKSDAAAFEASWKTNTFIEPRTFGGEQIIADRNLILGRDSFKRTDNASEQMNIDGLSGGTPVNVWNGTGAGDTGADWTHSGEGTESTAAAHSGTYGLDTGATSENDNTNFDNGSMIDVDSTHSELLFWMQPKAYPGGSRTRVVWLDNANAVVGNALRIDDYVTNMDLDVWQQVAIPISDFALTGNVQKLRVRYFNSSGQQFWFDDIALVPAGGAGPYRFQFAVPDASIRYHISMLVLMMSEPVSGWTSTAFAHLTGGIDNGLLLRQRRISTSDILWKFNSKDNIDLYGQYHPQDDVQFADDQLLVGFMVKPGKASIIVSNDDVLEFVVRDDLSGIDAMRAYAHYGVEIVS